MSGGFGGRLPGETYLIESEETIAASRSRRIESLPAYILPPFFRLLQIELENSSDTPNSDDEAKNFITNVAILHDAAFSPKCPLLGSGHHFSVYASVFEDLDQDFCSFDGREFNKQVYCLKIANFSSASSTGNQSEFRKDYYHTVLQECRVLLHPEIRKSENIISLFGLDFHEDYDDYRFAWPVLIMEYAEYGTLDTFQEDFDVDASLTKDFLLDVARGIDALHQCNIVHGDVKSENVVICRHITRKYIARLSDFGLSVINPDPNIDTHRLLGGTPLWMAPEYDRPLSVQGLKWTDVYSYGLLVWRVLTRKSNPYYLIRVQILDGHEPLQPPDLQTIVSRAKSSPNFGLMILQAISRHAPQVSYASVVIRSTISLEPSTRDLARVISILTDGQQQIVEELDIDEEHWESEKPACILENVAAHFPHDMITLTIKGSVLHTLHSCLNSVFDSATEELQRYAGWLLFQLSASQFFPCFTKTADESCQILRRLCGVDSLVASSIAAQYFQIHGQDLNSLDVSMIELSASNGSYYSFNILRGAFSDRFEALVKRPLQFEAMLDPTDPEHEGEIDGDFDAEDDTRAGDDTGDTFMDTLYPVIHCCRMGDFEGVKMALAAGNSAYQEVEGRPSALHWLVSFHNTKEIEVLVPLLLENGAVLDAWEGDHEIEEEYTFGRVVGTPLHWAVWHRNLALVKTLTAVDHNPELEFVNRAILLAALLHFDDVLEVLKEWSKTHDRYAKYDWHAAFVVAIDGSLWLPRLLRHGLTGQHRALIKTLDQLISVSTPSTEDMGLLFHSAIVFGNSGLLRYLFRQQGLKSFFSTLDKPYLRMMCFTIGNQDVFDILLAEGMITSATAFGTEQFNPLQLCILSRQRNPYFITRLLEIGCPVDSLGGTEQSGWTPFYFAVSMGMYEIATTLLEHGADKDCLAGWGGGYTVAMGILVTWRDVPISRLKYLLEDLPRIGFGHVSFWAWPGMKGNIMYGLSLNPWASYTAGYRLGETAKYILSNLADKSCLNQLDVTGCSALRMAAAAGNLEVMQALIGAGIDVNAGIGFTPLFTATEWLGKCQNRLRRATCDKSGSEKRLTAMLTSRAEKCVDLLRQHGAFERNIIGSMFDIGSHVKNGFNIFDVGMETLFEMVGYDIQGGSSTRPGTLALNPAAKKDFNIFHGQKSPMQKILGRIGQRIDTARGTPSKQVSPRWQAHSCWPWVDYHCVRDIPRGPSQGSRQVNQNRMSNGLRSSFAAAQIPPSLVQSNSTSQGSAMKGLLTLPILQNEVANTTSRSIAPSPQQKSHQSVQTTIETIRNDLFAYFLEAPEAENLELTQRQQKAAEILRGSLENNIRLVASYEDIGSCVEYFEIKSVVEDSLDALAIRGIGLIPEILAGNALLIHVLINEGV